AYAQLAAEGYLKLRQGAAPSVRETDSPMPPACKRGDERACKVRYDLRPHLPEASLFPRHAWLRSLRHAVTTAGNAELSYSGSRGLEQLRTEVSAYLGRARGIAAEPDQIVITAGCTHSLNLVFNMLARRGAGNIGLENPSDFLVHRIAERAGLTPT